jgi:hypothetical protein
MKGHTKTRTIYSERYVSRAVHVTANEARSVLDTASVIYAVEQGEIEIPSFENQRRMVCVMRFERILPDMPRADTEGDRQEPNMISANPDVKEHVSAPVGYRCADCQMDGEACPLCYAAWWKRRHPNTIQLPVTDTEGDPPTPPCNSDCNPYRSPCGATFCTYEEMAAHITREHPGAVLPDPPVQP